MIKQNKKQNFRVKRLNKFYCSLVIKAKIQIDTPVDCGSSLRNMHTFALPGAQQTQKMYSLYCSLTTSGSKIIGEIRPDLLFLFIINQKRGKFIPSPPL